MHSLPSLRSFTSASLSTLALLVSVINGAGILFFCCCSRPAAAQLQNASFEDPPLPDGSLTDNTIAGWSGNPVFSTAFGVMNPAPGDVTGPIPDGPQVAYLMGDAIAQSTSVIIQPSTTYTLTAWIGNHTAFSAGFVIMQLWAGGTVSDGSVSGGTLAADTFLLGSPGPFTPVSAQFTATADTPLSGQVLSARFLKVDGQMLLIDQVALQQSGGSASAAPEPATCVLLATGLLPVVVGAVIRRRSGSSSSKV